MLVDGVEQVAELATQLFALLLQMSDPLSQPLLRVLHGMDGRVDICV